MVKLRYPKKKKKPSGFHAAVRAARKAYQSEQDHRTGIIKALRAARKRVSPKSKITFRKRARIIPVPKRGGYLPALFAGLAALGSLIGGASAVAKAVKASEEAKDQLKESRRHNEAMESIALRGKGMDMKLAPYKKGLGVYLSPKNTY